MPQEYVEDLVRQMQQSWMLNKLLKKRRSDMEIQNVAVLGLGIMGNGIAQVAAQSGFSVFAYDISKDAINKGLNNISSSLERLKKKGKIDDNEMTEVLARVKTSTDLSSVVEAADLVIEVAPEVLDLKKDIYRNIAPLLKPDVIITSNTSQFSITELASATDRPDRFIGTHWFNPPPIMKLVEVVRGLETSDETLSIIEDICKRFGKDTVVCQKDTPGFITTRLSIALFSEACRIVEEGVANPSDVDKATRLAFNYPMGPFEVQDFSGLDTTLHVSAALGEMFDHLRPSATFKNLVRSGRLGRKSGRGWHNYD